MSLAGWKIKDRFTNNLVRVKDTAELDGWLRSRYATLMPEQERCIIRLCASLDDDEDPKWWAAACELSVERVKKAGKK